ncbi:TolC family protein [Solimonas terrae]|uniref:TolC family protein n=1 Tax=Solimonas terrae TaxID=1396819 RepID=A0A6M2BXQ1_9GAMM|nr:TolC family protein [Solimonas terrae]NGY07055.1 TolC family protein [Solimonas terrae]
MSSSAHRSRKPARRFAAAVLILLPVCAQAAWFDDPLGTSNDMPASNEQQIAQAGLSPCTSGELPAPLGLSDAISRALCFNPQTRQAWSAIVAQAAAVGIGRSAYLPGVSASASVGRVGEDVSSRNAPEFDASLRGGSNEQSLALNWVLYDFGLRAASLRRERALLDAAAASRDEIVRSVFIETVQAYFTAIEARDTLAAQIEAEQRARRSVEVVDAKVDAGVGSEADRLQANTASALATLNRIHGRQNLENAMGALAVVVGVRPGTLSALQESDPHSAEIPGVTALADHLIDQTLRSNPRIADARAQLGAARDAVSAAQAAGRPSIALTALGDRSANPVDRVSTAQTIETSSIGLQLTIPLFDGYAHRYRVRQARAELEGREATLFAAQQQVAEDVWNSYVAVHASGEDLQACKILLDNASQSFALAVGRYQSGVGSIVELLKAQSDLASARESDAQSRSRWQLARLQLAAGLGELNLSSLQDGQAMSPPAQGAPRSVILQAPAAPTTVPRTPVDLPPSGPPVITSITPEPVPGSRGPQALTITGRHFVDGALVNLHDRTHDMDFPDRQPVLVEDASIWVWADVGCGANWTAEVVNPDGRHSASQAFRVVGPCHAAPTPPRP